jgi:hypothetical protein
MVCTTPREGMMKEAGEKRGILIGMGLVLDYEIILLGVSSVWKNSGNFERYPKSYLLSVFQCRNNKGVCHTVALSFTLRSILRQKKNYENSNISPCKI